MRASRSGLATVLLLCFAGLVRADMTPTDVPSGIPISVLLQLIDPVQSSYQVDYLGTTGNTWSYRVAEINGRDLSNVLFLLDCVFDDGTHLWQHVTGVLPQEGFEAGYDGSSGQFGIKWNTMGAFSSGIFAFTLDNDYALGTMQVKAKGGPNDDFGSLAGPACCVNWPPVTQIPAPDASILAMLGLVSLGLCFRRGRGDR